MLSEAPTIAGYTLVERLGGGGGGSVWRAVGGGAGKEVALKLLNRRLGDGPQAARAWRELRFLEDLRLPTLPRLIDYGEADGRLYMAVEYINGLPLDRHADAQALDRRARVELLARVCDAVQQLHEHGVIHRDLKPSNILVDERGRPVIIDLGIAALPARDAMETLTEEGQPVGTPAFMSPEQARGDRAGTSTRSDVYALGAVGFLLLTGNTPHETRTTLHEAVRRVATDQPRDPRSLDATLPKPLAAVLAQAVHRDPARRYASAAEFAADLRRWLAGQHVLASRPTPWVRLTRWAGAHPIGVTALLCAALAGLTLVATLGVVRVINNRPFAVGLFGPSASNAALFARSGRVLATWSSPDPRARLIIAEDHRQPDHLGGRHVAVVGFPFAWGKAATDGRLCAFLVDDPGRALWMRGQQNEDIVLPSHLFPPEDDYKDPVSFRLGWAESGDMLPDVPGVEIAAVHKHSPWSATVIRIYDLAGNVLSEIWHDGHINDGAWLKDERLLLFTGVNSEGGGWQARGETEATLVNRHPTVLFAWRPVEGRFADHLLTSPALDLEARPVWYRSLPPRASLVELNPAVKARGRQGGDDACAAFEVALNEPSIARAVTLRIDAEGRILGSYKNDRLRAEPCAELDDLTLTPLPPLLPYPKDEEEQR